MGGLYCVNLKYEKIVRLTIRSSVFKNWYICRISKVFQEMNSLSKLKVSTRIFFQICKKGGNRVAILRQISISLPQKYYWRCNFISGHSNENCPHFTRNSSIKRPSICLWWWGRFANIGQWWNLRPARRLLVRYGRHDHTPMWIRHVRLRWVPICIWRLGGWRHWGYHWEVRPLQRSVGIPHQNAGTQVLNGYLRLWWTYIPCWWMYSF